MTRLAPRWNLISRPLNEIMTEFGDCAKILTCPDANHTDPKVVYQCALQMPSNSPVNQVVWVNRIQLIKTAVPLVKQFYSILPLLTFRGIGQCARKWQNIPPRYVLASCF